MKEDVDVVAKILELASAWEREALGSVPAAYADRDLHQKYLNLDNEAAGLMRAAEELRDLLADVLDDETQQCVGLLLNVVRQGWERSDGTIDTMALSDVADAVRYLAERGLVEVTAEMSERYLLARAKGADDEHE